jgi:hypothetical protein
MLPGADDWRSPSSTAGTTTGAAPLSLRDEQALGLLLWAWLLVREALPWVVQPCPPDGADDDGVRRPPGARSAGDSDPTSAAQVWLLRSLGRGRYGRASLRREFAPGCEGGAASVASFLAAVLAAIYLCNVCSCQEILRRNGRG